MTPSLSGFLEQYQDILSRYDPTAMWYLGGNGEWLGDPQELHQRANADLWFHFWRNPSADQRKAMVDSLIGPTVADPDAWRAAVALAGNGGVGAGPGLEHLAAAAAIGRSVELLALERLHRMPANDWDTAARRRKQWFAERHKIRHHAAHAPADGSEVALDKLLDRLRSVAMVQDTVFTIAAEAAVWFELAELLDRLALSGDPDETYGYIGELFATTVHLPALLRPALWLLADRSIPASSGLSYQAAHLLGKLQDPRSLTGLMAGFKRSSPTHTELRRCLLYAMGALRHPKSLPVLEAAICSPEVVADETGVSSTQKLSAQTNQTLEAVWAIGKIRDGIPALAALLPQVHNPDFGVRQALAWTLGMLGAFSRERTGSIPADIIVALMQLLRDHSPAVFEEAANSLKTLGQPEFPNALYLNNVATVPILALKPSRVGLYELSETVYDLLAQQPTVVMAVTGDSGTGKTYFCQSLLDGFGHLGRSDILYLARDNPDHTDAFNRMLGLRHLREQVAPQYYLNYPEDIRDDPDDFFKSFRQSHSDKRLIILDGWRDDVYFNHIVRSFTRRDFLDIIVTFQANYSTRRLNLESREGYLENVLTCLSYTEGPEALPAFTQEGRVFIYQLDNSIHSRLNGTETTEIFNRQKVTGWSGFVRLGRFLQGIDLLTTSVCSVPARHLNTMPATKPLPGTVISPLKLAEASFSRIPNENLHAQPNLLQRINIPGFPFQAVVHYTAGQIAVVGDKGRIALICGYNDRYLHGPAGVCPETSLAVVASDIFFVDVNGRLSYISLRQNTITSFSSPTCASGIIASDRHQRIISAHDDGTVGLWDLASRRCQIFVPGQEPVTHVAMDSDGTAACVVGMSRIVLIDADAASAETHDWRSGEITDCTFDRYHRLIIAFTDGEKTGAGLAVIPRHGGESAIINIPDMGAVNRVSSYYDGRIIVAASPGTSAQNGNLIIVNPGEGFTSCKRLPGHDRGTHTAFVIGPRIVACGLESDGTSTIGLWGTEGYVRQEHEKQRMMPIAGQRPAYYQSLF